jgi:hypothetical protein
VLVLWRPPCTEGNKARGGLAGSLIVTMAGNGPRKAHRDPLVHGEGPGLSTELPDRELGPREGFLARGSNED